MDIVGAVRRAVQQDVLASDERERLGRYKRAYQASATLESDQQTGNRVAFVAWLVATGDLTDDEDRCAGCGARLRFPVLPLMDAIARGVDTRLPWLCTRCVPTSPEAA